MIRDRKLIGNLPRHGVTLLELLIAITIMLLITAAAIPVLMPRFSNREIREAAREVSAFIGAARARAMSSGRPFGVRLEKIPGQVDASAILTYVEVPPPYAGDTLSSSVACCVMKYTDSNNITKWYNVVCSASGDVWDPGPIANPIFNPYNDLNAAIRPDDELQLNYQGHRYHLDFNKDGKFWELAETIPVNVNDVFPDPNEWTAHSETAADVPVVTREFYDRNRNGVLDQNEYVFDFNNDGKIENRSVPYQISRSPVKAQGEALILPNKTAIDLNFSGMSDLSFHPRNQHPNYPQDRYMGIDNGIVPVDDQRGVIIMFTPGGAVGYVHSYRQLPDGSWDIVEYHPASPVFLLVGRRDLIRPELYFTSIEGDFNYNWEVPTNLWVTIHHLNGLVTTADNAVVPPLPDPPDPVNQPRPVTGRVFNCRQFARDAHTNRGQ